ncbi:hypothetical protein KR009_008380 [Drosophila setifemur]|nr:hypothetical protein KR009_008380 [Drosophila setifemur]
MAALSFSPSPPPPAKSSSGESKENSQGGLGMGLGLELSLGLAQKATLKPFGKITVHNVLSESGANALQQHIANQNTIIRKIRDFGMLGAVQSAANSTNSTTPVPSQRKRPLGESKQNLQNQQANKTTASQPAKRSKQAGKQAAKQAAKQKLHLEKPPKQSPTPNPIKLTAEQELIKAAGTPGRKGLPLPQAVARRNARERNRVKQVNNGFALLRDKIPEEVSEAFEAQGAGRGASKKLSKVETLRMAVEYIRSLEKLLGFDFPPMGGQGNSSGSGDDSFMFIKDEFDGMDEQFDDSLSNYEMEEQQQEHSLSASSPGTNLSLGHSLNLNPTPAPAPTLIPTASDLLPHLTTLNGLQYIRIPGTNTYQLLTPELLGELSSGSGLGLGLGLGSGSEHVAAACGNLSRSPVPQQQQQQHQGTTTKVSPCSSPVGSISPVNELILQACAAQLQQQLIKQEYGSNINSGNCNTNCNNINSSSPIYQQQQQQQQQGQQILGASPILPAFYDQEPVSFYDNVVLPGFKKEFNDIMQQDQSGSVAGASSGVLSDESMIDAIDWWEAHTPKSEGAAANESSTAVLM